jgi:hypothetical protein
MSAAAAAGTLEPMTAEVPRPGHRDQPVLGGVHQLDDDGLGVGRSFRYGTAERPAQLADVGMRPDEPVRDAR